MYRRQYNARWRLAPHTPDTDPVSSDPAIDSSIDSSIDTSVVAEWDSEAYENACDTYEALRDQDQDAAAHLLAYIRAYEALQRGADTQVAPSLAVAPHDQQGATNPRELREPFDPMRLFAQLAKYYGWTDDAMRRTPWRRLLGYKREADRMVEEEQYAYDEAMRKGRSRQGNGRNGPRRRAGNGAGPDPLDQDEAFAEAAELAELSEVAIRARPYDGPVTPRA